MNFTRRDLLRNGWKIGGVLLGVAAGWTIFESLRPLSTGATSGVIKLDDPNTYQDGTATYVPEGRLYVTNAQGTLFALSQKCPHLGCRVPFCDSSGRFECACHGSIFDIGGEWITGPAPRGMDRYPLAVAGKELTVNTDTLETGPDHGAKQYLTPPKGPSCIGKG
jgi:cytochrome b6-f complex iron-sulfur subunit